MSNETQPAITKEVETEETSFKQVLPLVQITDDMLTDDDAQYPGPMVTAASGDNLTIANVQDAVAALTANDGAPASPLLTREEMAEPLPPADQVVEPNNVIEPEPEPEPEAMAETPASEPAPEREKVWNIHLQAWV